MFALIIGGSGSGKSECAEKLIMEISGARELYYIATMEPFGQEAERRILRHRRLRQGKGFRTIEKYTDLGSLSIPEGVNVLIECLSNLTANELFTSRMENNQHDAVKKIYSDIMSIRERAANLVVVTNDVFSDGAVHERETEEYICALGRLNRILAARAEKTIEVVCGIEVPAGQQIFGKA